MPPALSAIGPYASTATVRPTVESMPTAASATPKRPPVEKARYSAPAMMRIGITVDMRPTENPLNIVVAAPVSDCSLIVLTGLCSLDV